MAEKEIMFNDAMQQLEEIVRQLEQGDVPLKKRSRCIKKACSSQKSAIANCRMPKSSLSR